MGYVTGKKVRPLHINFSIYQDSDDLEFRVELISLMASSLKDMLTAAVESAKAERIDVFKRAVHKSKSTLVLVNDYELDLAVERFHERFQNVAERETNYKRLKDICLAVIDSLDYEAVSLKEKL